MFYSSDTLEWLPYSIRYYRNVFCVQHQCYIFIMHHVDVHIIHQLSDSSKFMLYLLISHEKMRNLQMS